MLSPRQEMVLAALSTELGALFAPVQVQKLFFLIDENAAQEVGGKQFNFTPYDYGPFDVEVYRDLEALRDEGFVQIMSEGGRASRRYSLTPAGYLLGQNLLQSRYISAADYLTRLSAWVRSLPFAQLVGAIYKEYPHMRENSVFNG